MMQKNTPIYKRLVLAWALLFLVACGGTEPTVDPLSDGQPIETEELSLEGLFDTGTVSSYDENDNPFTFKFGKASAKLDLATAELELDAAIVEPLSGQPMSSFFPCEILSLLAENNYEVRVQIFELVEPGNELDNPIYALALATAYTLRNCAGSLNADLQVPLDKARAIGKGYGHLKLVDTKANNGHGEIADEKIVEIRTLFGVPKQLAVSAQP